MFTNKISENPMKCEPSDLQALLTSIALGDQEAFSEFYSETSTRVYSLAVKVLVDLTLAEEVTQETYMQVWKDAKHYDESKGKPLSWVLMLCHRRAVDAVRKEQTRKKREEKYCTDPTMENDIVELSYSRTQLQTAVKELSPKQCAVIELVYFEGKIVKDAAEDLGIPVSTAKTRLRDGLNVLRKKIKGDNNV